MPSWGHPAPADSCPLGTACLFWGESAFRRGGCGRGEGVRQGGDVAARGCLQRGGLIPGGQRPAAGRETPRGAEGVPRAPCPRLERLRAVSGQGRRGRELPTVLKEERGGKGGEGAGWGGRSAGRVEKREGDREGHRGGMEGTRMGQGWGMEGPGWGRNGAKRDGAGVDGANVSRDEQGWMEKGWAGME